ncbi:Holliday junction branch migration protein RuvA [Patescibacteria group bacterium]|nr:Holliday junction branch migration protein RuvA [Patescibacteria group bacterium]
MIGSLRGMVSEIHAASILLEVAGVGYIVRVSSSTLTSVKKDDPCFMYIHDHVREDSHDLFGFIHHAEMELFERLLSVSGVGPKVALTILSVGSYDTVYRAILQGDLTMLTSMPGVGKKTAQKIILDLKGQLVEDETVTGTDGEVIDALVSLGYAMPKAREVVKSLTGTETDVAQRIREALKYLSA